MALRKKYFKDEKYNEIQNKWPKNFIIKGQRPSYISKTIHNWAKTF